MSCPEPKESSVRALPEEFKLQLGPHSAVQIEAMARALRDRGAKVVIDPQGNLVALRPA